MKINSISITIIGAILIAIVALITAVVVAFGLAIAYILTLTMKSLEMRQAIIPGAVFAGFSLYFCLKFFTFALTIGEKNDSCDECRYKSDDDDDDQYRIVVPRSFGLKGVGKKQAKRKTAHI